MNAKQFSIRFKNGRFFTSVFQSEEHLSLDLVTEKTTSGYTLDLDKSELINEVTNAVENYIEAFDKSAKHAKASSLEFNIHITIN